MRFEVPATPVGQASLGIFFYETGRVICLTCKKWMNSPGLRNHCNREHPDMRNQLNQHGALKRCKGVPRHYTQNEHGTDQHAMIYIREDAEVCDVCRIRPKRDNETSVKFDRFILEDVAW
jgi:hypothetical protein